MLHLFALLCQYYPLLCCRCSIFLICRNCMSTTSLVRCFCTTSPPPPPKTCTCCVWRTAHKALCLSLNCSATHFNVHCTYVERQFVCTVDFSLPVASRLYRKHWRQSGLCEGGCVKIAHLNGEVYTMFGEVVNKLFSL